jgi:hypothetical protein
LRTVNRERHILPIDRSGRIDLQFGVRVAARTGPGLQHVAGDLVVGVNRQFEHDGIARRRTRRRLHTRKHGVRGPSATCAFFCGLGSMSDMSQSEGGRQAKYSKRQTSSCFHAFFSYPQSQINFLDPLKDRLGRCV